MSEKINLSFLKDQLPPIIARHKINNYLGGMISKGYLQNIDSIGQGPKRIRFGRIICYSRDDLISWLENRAEILENKKP